MDKSQINIFNFSTSDAEVATLMLKWADKKMKDGKALVNFTNMEDIKELVERRIKGPTTRKRTSSKQNPLAKKTKSGNELEVVDVTPASPKAGSSKSITKKPGASDTTKAVETQIQNTVTQFIPIRPRPVNIQTTATQASLNNQQQFLTTANMNVATPNIQMPVLHQWQQASSIQTPTTVQNFVTPQPQATYYYSNNGTFPYYQQQGTGMSNSYSSTSSEEDEEEERIPLQDITNFGYDD